MAVAGGGKVMHGTHQDSESFPATVDDDFHMPEDVVLSHGVK